MTLAGRSFRYERSVAPVPRRERRAAALAMDRKLFIREYSEAVSSSQKHNPRRTRDGKLLHVMRKVASAGRILALPRLF
jgi:hypothetical protein